MCQFGWHFGFRFNICLNLQAWAFLVHPLFWHIFCFILDADCTGKVFTYRFFAKTRMNGCPDQKGRNRLQSVSTKICRSCFWGKWLKWGRMVGWSKARWTSMRDLAKVSRNDAEVLRRDSSSGRASSRGMLSEASWNKAKASHFEALRAGN